MNRVYYITGYYAGEGYKLDTYVMASNEPDKARNKYMTDHAIYDDDIIFYTDKPIKAGDNLFDDFYVDSIIDIM